MEIKLQVRGASVIPFKNRKFLARGRLITEPKVKKHMEQIAEAFVSQLLAASRTCGDATWTDVQRLSLIASSLPADDCWTCIPQLEIRGERANDINEVGADITICPVASEP